MRTHTSSSQSEFKASVDFIKRRAPFSPAVAVVLGSGLGGFAERLKQKQTISVDEIPYYPQPSVVGHCGKIIFGRIDSTPIVAFQGRVHLYESGSLQKVLYPIRIAHALRVHSLLVTNAAGGINKQFSPGDLMLITDQMNLTFESPLLALKQSKPNYRPRDLHQPIYDRKYLDIIAEVARECRIPLKQGIYCGLKGPSYETAAEVEMVRRIGGDAVGMSTVNEVSFARALGMRVAGISCITNLATGIGTGTLSHDEVTEVANRVETRFERLLAAVLPKIG